jgi:hypothetical protein
MRELMQFLPVLVFVIVIISVVRNAAKVLRKLGEQTQARTPPTPADFDPELAQRTRRIQEEIRRKIAERRGTVLAPEPVPVESTMEPPVVFAEERVERDYGASDAAVLERQQQLADQMRALEHARAAEHRRATQVTTALRTESESERGQLVGSRGSLLAELRDPAGLRRAFVLREVLGTPVGLR